MNIRKIHIDYFAGKKDFELDFERGINILQGQNETGKTTLASFIAYVFYGLPKQELGIRFPWDGNKISGYLITEELFDDNNIRYYRIERETTSFSRDNFKIIDLSNNNVILKNKIPGEAFFGIPNDLFLRTAYVSQTDGSIINGTGIGDMIQNILYSADETVNIKKALKTLDDSRKKLLHKDGNGGIIYELRKNCSNLEKRLITASEENKNIISLEGKFDDSEESRRNNDERISAFGLALRYSETTADVARLDSLKELSLKRDQFNEKLNKLKEENTFNGFVPDEKYASELIRYENETVHLREDFAEIKNEIIAITAQESEIELETAMVDRINSMGGRNSILEKFEISKKKYYIRRLAGIFLCAFCLIGIIAAVILFFNNYNFYALISVLFAIAVMTAAGFIINSSDKNRSVYRDIYKKLDVDNPQKLKARLDAFASVETKLKLHNEKLNILYKRKADIDKKYTIENNALFDLLAQWDKTELKPAEAAEFAKTFLSTQTYYITELDKINTSIFILKEQLTIEYNPEEEAALREKYIEIKKAYTEKFGENPPAESINELRRSFDYYTKANTALEERCREYEKQLTILKTTAEKPSELADQIYALKSRIAALEIKHKAYLLASEKLSLASDNQKDRIAPALSSAASDLLAFVTNGKYNNLDVTRDMNFNYKTVENEGFEMSRAAEFLSAGTLDVAYISLRLALVDILFTRLAPPIIFDESFARCDDERMKNMFAIMMKYAENGTQIILLTSQKRDISIASEFFDKHDSELLNIITI